VRAARAELAPDRLPPPTQRVPLPRLTAASPRAAASVQPPEKAPPRTNLPAQATPLIGREREVATVAALLRQPGVRLVTLTGPGGTGKTRLALQVADELLGAAARQLPAPGRGAAGALQRERGPGGEEPFPDGVWFVNLAPIDSPGLVGTTIAHALGVAEGARAPIEQHLHAFLRAKRALLLLDNFEPVLDAAPLVAELLAERPVCERCGAARSTDVHEPRMRSRRPDMDITDPRECVCLCRACHTWVHTHPAEATREGWLIPSWAELAECGVHPTTAACETCTACRKCGPCECELSTEWAREAAWPG